MCEPEQPNLPSLVFSNKYSDVIRLHPLVMFAALAWTLYLSSDQWITVANAKDDVSQRAFDTYVKYTAYKDTQNTDTYPHQQLSKLDNDGSNRLSEQSSRIYTKETFNNFNVFLAIHGIAIGLPIVVSDVNSPISEIPHISEGEFNYKFSQNFTANLFDGAFASDSGRTANHEIDKAFFGSPVVSTNRLDTITELTDQINPRTILHNWQYNDDYTSNKSDEIHYFAAHSDLNHIEYITDTSESARASQSDTYGFVDIISKIIVDNKVNSFTLNGVNVTTTLDYKELYSVISQIYKYIDNVDIVSYFDSSEHVETNNNKSEPDETKSVSQLVSTPTNTESVSESKTQVVNTKTESNDALLEKTVPSVAAETAPPVACPSSNNLRLLGLWKNGVSGSVCGLI